MESAWTGGPAPFIIVKARILERFGWTLDEFARQPADEVLQLVNALALYESHLREGRS